MPMPRSLPCCFASARLAGKPSQSASASAVSMAPPVIATVVHDAERVAVGLGSDGDKVAAAQCDGVETELAGRQVDQPFDDEHDLRAAGAAIGGRRYGVGDRAATADVSRRDVVDPRHQT